MPKFENIADWVKKKYSSQAKAAEALEKRQGVISSWITGRNNPSSEMQEVLRRLGYDGPWPQEEAKSQSSDTVLTAESFIELRGAVKALREDLKQAERVQYALIGAIRQLAKAANLPHLSEPLE